MPPLLLLAWRSVASRPLRTTLTLLLVALGTGILVAVTLTNATIDASLAEAARRMAGRSDLDVRAFGEAGFSRATVGQIAALPEVRSATPVVSKRVFYRTPNDSGFLTLIGVDPARA